MWIQGQPWQTIAVASFLSVLISGCHQTVVVSDVPEHSAPAVPTASLSDTIAPIVNAFTIPATSTSATVLVTAFTATDNDRVTGYLITDSATAPLASSADWSASAQTSYLFSGIPQGVPTVKTLYAWAKDAAGNISSGIRASISITLPPPSSPSAQKLLTESDFSYLGAFRVPKGDLGGPVYHGLAYGGAVIAYNPVNNSIFITGHDSDQLVAEISIPPLVNSADYSKLNTASVLQNLADITEGNRRNIRSGGVTETSNPVKIGGLLLYQGKLLGSVYNYYDAGWDAVLSHFFSGTTLAASGDFSGMFQVGMTPNPIPQAGFVAGYMAPIPASWQPVLGGTVLTGQSALSVIGRTSLGPAAVAFDPATLGSTPAPAAPLLFYPSTNPTLGQYESSYTSYTASTHISGMIFPSETRSILYAGRHGLGPFCYGPGTPSISEDGNTYDKPSPNNTCNGVVMTDTAHPCCYDPANLTKGSHNYPYVENYIWAYDAEDFARVKAGGRIIDNPSPNLADGVSPSSTAQYQPWHIKPYAMWNMQLPSPKHDTLIFTGAMAYDEANQLLYLAQPTADVSPNEMSPIIHVFHVNTR